MRGEVTRGNSSRARARNVRPAPGGLPWRRTVELSSSCDQALSRKQNQGAQNAYFDERRQLRAERRRGPPLNAHGRLRKEYGKRSQLQVCGRVSRPLGAPRKRSRIVRNLRHTISAESDQSDFRLVFPVAPDPCMGGPDLGFRQGAGSTTVPK